MEERIRKILFNKYNMNIEKLTIMEGGFCPDETYLFVTSDQNKYIVKYIRYSYSIQHLKLIFKFENILHDLYKYPYPQIILSNKQEVVIYDENRFLFVQTFIEGIEPTREILDKDNVYLQEMGRLLAQWRIASRKYSFDIQLEEYQQLSDKWCKKQQIDDHIDPFLLTNFIECKNYLMNLHENLEHGLIHNDFHPNNSIMTKDGKIFIIDFIDACQSVFVADLATYLFHLLTDKKNGLHRAKVFLDGYQQIVKLTPEEINVLDMFVRFKFTLSLIEDLRYSIDTNHPFVQSCFDLLHTLNDQPNFAKNLL
jgi:Ser/Thr protein kinase RdoA (MazF antagonist)